MLSQPSQYGLSTDNDLQHYFRNSSSGVYLNLRVWVKLGTATNFIIGVGELNQLQGQVFYRCKQWS